MSGLAEETDIGNAKLAERYLQLMKNCLTRSLDQVAYGPIPPSSRTLFKRLRYQGYSAIQGILKPFHLSLVQINRPTGETMMGMGALNNLHDCLNQIQTHAVPGDLVETGVWRGGGTIFMRAFLIAHDDRDRNVWVCDSFEGLPKPKGDIYEMDKNDKLWESEYLAVSEEEVKANFRKYDLLDSQVKFLKGFFSDTMPTAPIERIAVLRLDGDMYESTIVVLNHLYAKLSPGGYVIFDDYGMIPGCSRAVEDFRRENDVREELKIIGYVKGQPLGAYWQKA
jgi:O-methyltransferase